MLSIIRAACVALGVFTVLTGVAYPLLLTGIGAVAFPAQTEGSLITTAGATRGSALVGQEFTQARYLWGRPSATTVPYDARAGGGSNLGPTNPLLDTLVRKRVAALRAAAPSTTASVPVELVTASGSGLDPHLSPAAAMFQVHRIAVARNVDSARVAHVIMSHLEQRTLGVLGESRVNVLRVNLALDSLTVVARQLRP